MSANLIWCDECTRLIADYSQAVASNQPNKTLNSLLARYDRHRDGTKHQPGRK